jgi:hypothetical protein
MSALRHALCANALGATLTAHPDASVFRRV